MVGAGDVKIIDKNSIILYLINSLSVRSYSNKHPNCPKGKVIKMATEIDILKSVPFFQDLSSDELEALAPMVHRVKIQEGETFTEKGMAATTLFINLTGNAMISYKADKAITLHEKGDIVGVSVGVVPSVYKGTTLALTDGEWLSVSGQDLLDLIQGNNDLGDKVMKKINDASVARAAVIESE